MSSTSAGVPARQANSPQPAAAGRLIRNLAVASLVANIVIVVTGGAVRLTASGLGCPEWPLCTADSLVTTPEMGLHGIIEFGNRMLTFVLTAVAFATVFSVSRVRAERRDLWWLSIALLAGVPAQAVIGGITVLTDLNPWVVGLHFLASTVMISVAVVMVNRSRLSALDLQARHAPLADRSLRPVLGAIGVLAALTVVLGVVVTGSGPHAGDHGAARNGLNPDLITRIHVVPVYLLVFALAVALYLVFRRGADARVRKAVLLLGVVVLAQAAIGYVQHFLHLPITLVALHMLGACLLTAAAAQTVYIGFNKQVPGGAAVAVEQARAARNTRSGRRAARK
ncbi:COX15/CtaA family protein [Arthrobacter yangruifuii]|uniref:COX15/CtaA family protein n=1 Tax=Arthrobacter yangruifuii TaxID=2606616 RepID=UPI001FEF7618|nr:COX15/CtaA family protein [Arthrobacter yangruifuii]